MNEKAISAVLALKGVSFVALSRTVSLAKAIILANLLSVKVPRPFEHRNT